MADSRGTGEAEVSGEAASVVPHAVLASHRAVPGLAGSTRTLWLRLEPDAPDEAVAHFEAETPFLAETVPAIRNERRSRLSPAASGPRAMRWTRLREQAFETLDLREHGDAVEGAP